MQQSLKDQGIPVRPFDEMLQLGSEKPCQPTVRPVAEDLCTIMYTSGTTGAEWEVWRYGCGASSVGQV